MKLTCKIVGICILLISAIASYDYIRCLNNTVYSLGYSRKGFNSINVGDDETTVIKQLGRPLSVSARGEFGITETPGTEHVPGASYEWMVFRYSEPKKGDNRIVRDIYFQSGKVTEVVAEMFAD